MANVENLSREELLALVRMMQVAPENSENDVSMQNQPEEESAAPPATKWQKATTTWIETRNSVVTKELYTKHLRRFEKFMRIERRKTLQQPEDVEILDLQAFKQYLEDGFEGNTPRSYWIPIRGLFTFCKENNFCATNIASSIKAPKKVKPVKQKDYKVLEPSDVFKVIQAANEKTKRLIAIMYYFGFRVSEAIAVRGENIDVDVDEQARTVIHIHGVRGAKNGELIDMKIGSANAVAILERLAETEGFIFAGQKENTHITKRTALNWVKKAAKKAQLQLYDFTEDGKCSTRIAPHYFRHAIATHMLRHKKDIKTISMFLRHASTSITETYLHANSEEALNMDI